MNTKHNFSVFLIIAAVLSAMMVLSSCGESPLTEEELKSTVSELIEASAEINEIYFGDGISSEEPEDFEPTGTLRYFLATDEKYRHTGDIKTATEKVYSKAYCAYLYPTAFEGMTTDAGTIYARYIDSEAGDLTVRGGLSEEAMTLGRTYNYDTVSEVSHSADRITFTVDSLGADGKPLEIKLSIVLEENGWRLDAPTY